MNSIAQRVGALEAIEVAGPSVLVVRFTGAKGAEAIRATAAGRTFVREPGETEAALLQRAKTHAVAERAGRCIALVFAFDKEA